MLLSSSLALEDVEQHVNSKLMIVDRVSTSVVSRLRFRKNMYCKIIAIEQFSMWSFSYVVQ